MEPGRDPVVNGGQCILRGARAPRVMKLWHPICGDSFSILLWYVNHMANPDVSAGQVCQ